MNVSSTFTFLATMFLTSILFEPAPLQRTDATVATQRVSSETLLRENAPLLLAGNTACNPRVKICEE